MAFHFEQRPPTAKLAPWVESLWYARGRIEYAREHIAPSGAAVAVINLGDPIVHATAGEHAMRIEARSGWLTGPHDRPSLNEPQGETHCYGVVATPVGCWTLFGLEPRRLRGRVAALEQWRAGPALRAALCALPSEDGLDLLPDQLEAQLGEPVARHERIAEAIAWLDGAPGLTVAEVARRLGVTQAYLDREFSRVVGLGPRRLAAILRVRRMLDDLDLRREPDWVALATRYGWYDQSHMIRDFKRYTGVAPTAYVAAQRAHFDPAEYEEASGFVPEGSRR